MFERLGKWRWITLAVVVLVAAAFAGPLLYNHFMASPAPAQLALPVVASPSPSSSSQPATTVSALDGAWHVGSATVVGYRVTAHALGFGQTFVGRTGKVWGSIKVANGSVSRGSFSVDMTSFSGSKRERQVADTKTYPTATFVLTRPFKAKGSATGAVRHYSARGNLILRGRTIPVTLTVSQERKGSVLYVLATCPVDLAHWHIAVPFGVKSHGTVEILLGLVRGVGNTSAS
jgi:polyisoprenoid-binding protein YceI